jgi:hypothetical protein
MNINCYFDPPGGDWNTTHYFQGIYEALKNHYKDYKFNFVDSMTLVKRKNEPCIKYAHPHMVIENVDTKKYFVITYWDKMECICKYTGWDMENLVEIFTSSGVHKNDINYQPLELKYTPFSYLTPRMDIDVTISELKDTDNNDRIIPEKPQFKGFLYLFRKYLESDDRFFVREKGNGEYLQFTDYIKHLNKFAINMNLNGAGEICYRDMEILGLGTALFRPKLLVQFDDPLIPDHHYISVDYDSIKDEKKQDIFFKKFSDLIIQRWNEVVKDKEYINFVAQNGRKWFENNVSKEKHGEIAIKLIDFNKLK